MCRFYHAVRYKDLLDDPYSDISNYLKSCGNVCAIVYCLERAACDDLAVHLTTNGIPCAGTETIFLTNSGIITDSRFFLK